MGIQEYYLLENTWAYMWSYKAPTDKSKGEDAQILVREILYCIDTGILFVIFLLFCFYAFTTNTLEGQ